MTPVAPRRFPETVERGLRRADAAILSVRDRMTPGQRWTAALAGVLAISVLLFGGPVQRVVVPGVRSAPTASAGSQPLSDVAPTAPDTSVPASDGLVGPPPTAAAPSSPTASPRPDASGPTGAGGAGPTPTTAAPGPRQLDVLAVVAPASATGRSEADVARVFAADARAPIEVVEADPVAGSEPCATLADGGDVVVLGEGFSSALIDCLVAADVAVVAFSDDGDRPPTDGATGQVLSTRRGFVDSLLELGRWGAAGDALAGPVGIVAHPDRVAEVEALVPRLRTLGVDVVAVSHPAGGPGSVSEGTRAFVGAGVEVVVLATPVPVQQRWVAQHTLLDPSVRFVVADVADAVQQEDYPPTFDGALALSTLRVPWFAREHDETAVQRRCRRQWEAAVTPPTVLGSDELRWVHSWCQHVDIVEAVVSGVAGGEALPDALRSTRVASPLTSDLGPLPGQRWGPVADAVLVWRAGCGCWREQRPFQARAVG